MSLASIRETWKIYTDEKAHPLYSTALILASEKIESCVSQYLQDQLIARIEDKDDMAEIAINVGYVVSTLVLSKATTKALIKLGLSPRY